MKYEEKIYRRVEDLLQNRRNFQEKKMWEGGNCNVDSSKKRMDTFAVVVVNLSMKGLSSSRGRNQAV